MKLCDTESRPSLCTVCGNSGDENTKFVDTECVREGPVVYDKESGGIAVDPRGAQITLEDVYLCQSCIADAAEIAEFVPNLHRRHLEEIRRLRVYERDWDDLEAVKSRYIELLEKVEVAA